MSGRGFLVSAAVAAAGMAAWQWWRSQTQSDNNNNNKNNNNNNNNNNSSQATESSNHSNTKSNNGVATSSSSSLSSSSSSSSSPISIPSASFLTTEYHMSPGIITCASLAQLLSLQHTQPSSDARVIVLDASWFLPQAKRDPEAEFRTYRIYGASFWNIDTCADTSSGYLPHMLPSTSLFETTCYQVGIRSAQDRIVVYDTSGAFCGSARLWWNFRCFGWPADRIHVLHGGMKEMAQKYPEWIDNTPYKQKEPEDTPRLNRWHARFVPSWYRSKHDVLHTLSTSPSFPPEIFIDVRDRNRYLKIDGEPRPIKYRGHIPGAKHLFHASLITVSTQQQRLKSRQEMEAIFKDCLGFSLSSPPSPVPVLVTYCGSGVTAATVAWVLSLLGYPEDSISLYDGSWAEYGNDDNVPIE